METLALLEIQNLNYQYPKSSDLALRNINLKIDEGEFLLVVGGSGSGKSSLARLLAGLIPEFYGGKIQGKLLFQGKELKGDERLALNSHVGIVFQDPEKQLVMTSVEAEIAFGLENLGVPRQEMFRRVAEVMTFLNLAHLKKEFTANLSGGEKQKVALAAVIAMHPRILVLDEPTSQLDPVAAGELLDFVEYLNKELGYTVVLIEQRLERCFHLADRLLVMEQGEIICDGPPGDVARWQVGHKIPFIPPVARFFASLNSPVIPLTVKDGRQELNKYLTPGLQEKSKTRQRFSAVKDKNRVVLQGKDLWYTYPGGAEVIRGQSLCVEEGEFVVILGANAAGKSTLLKLLAGLFKPDRGSVRLFGKDTRQLPLNELGRQVGYLSQNPNDYLFQDTVEDELLFTLHNFQLADEGKCEEILKRLNLYGLRHKNPRDLSSGERQRVALASIMVAGPPLLLLDEPTRGIDYRLKKELGSSLHEITASEGTVVMVTHDVEFAAEYASRVVMVFDGMVACDGSRDILGESIFYAPQMARLFRGTAADVLTVDEGLEKVTGGDLDVCQTR
ncbi:MAG: energy-coupling factor transporter ATPase [Syntrophaceticus sp.]|nr:energy-coupling factor transporter ATPase [Syntrophaceticus sp.]MDD4360014.1 energy-coupling factor transporter ATPase [Syntrophaceticus sp.]MDD4783266.1 energy-coupling factor transporter ATPase [Syntrophaceticus sp.]